jgi:hypothetical protein
MIPIPEELTCSTEIILIPTGAIHITTGVSITVIPIPVLVLALGTLILVSVSTGVGHTVILIMTHGMAIILIILITVAIIPVIAADITRGTAMTNIIPVMEGEKDRVPCLPELMKMHLLAVAVTQGEMLPYHQERLVQAEVQEVMPVIMRYLLQQAEELIPLVEQV